MDAEEGDDDEEWESGIELIDPYESFPLWKACKATEFKHLPWGVTIEDLPAWLTHDFSVYNARYSYLKAKRKRDKEFHRKFREDRNSRKGR